MNNMKKRLSALAILASILLIGCAADKGDAKTDETVDANTDSAVATEALTPEESVLKHLPEASYFNGENFNIGWSQQYDFNEVYFTLEETEGDSIYEAVYERNRMTEEKLGITIVGENIGSWLDIPKTVAKLVQSDDDTYDVFCMSTVQTFNCVLQGYLCDISALDVINFENPWWDSQAILEQYSHGTDNVYFISGDINYQDDYALSAVMFNKRLCAEQDIQPYDDVRNNTWTVDTYFKYLSLFGADLDGNGKYTKHDMYGATNGSGILSYFLAASGEHLVCFDKEGNAYLNSNERIFDVANKVLNLVNDKNNPSYCIVDANPAIDWVIGGTLFPNEHAAFTEDSIHKINEMRFTMEEDFGVLPYPKFDEDQKEYHAPLSTASATVFSIPVSNDKAEMSAWIMEMMGMYSTDTVRYAAMEKVLMGKSIRDSESEDMLNIIFDTKFYDLGFWGSEIYNEVCPMVRSYKNNFVSLIESMQNKIEKQYETVKEYYSFD